MTRMANKIQSFHDLLAWQKAMDLVELVYRTTVTFPPSERFGLSAQMRKAAVSIASNVAEGSRHRLPGYISRVTIALGEHAELETQMLVAKRLGYITESSLRAFNASSTEVGELTHGLNLSLQTKLARTRKEKRPSYEYRIPNSDKY
jgi:four helix bundle protein